MDKKLELDELLTKELSRRQLLETGALGAAMLALSACSGAGATGTTGGSGSLFTGAGTGNAGNGAAGNFAATSGATTRGSAGNGSTGTTGSGTTGTTGSGTTGTTGSGTTGAAASSGLGSVGGTTGGGQCPTNSNTLVLALSQYPALAQVGGGVALTDNRYSDPVCGQNGLIVLQPSQGKFVALSTSCTHACCTVNLQGGQLFCPCHASTFDLQGNVTGGPAPPSLPSLPVCSDGQNVYVQLA